MAHVNFKTINKLAKLGLVDGLPLKLFTNEHNCVACNKGKQHKASYKAIFAGRTITEPLQLVHINLFDPTSIRSIDHKYYSLVVTDDFSRFCWAFFLGTKDETFYILKDFIALIENQLNKKDKAIKYDNGTEFQNARLIVLCGEKGIKRDYSNARTLQQNKVAERKNRTLIEAARSMLADSKLPTMFWTEAVSTACYVLNRVSITKHHNQTPYELLSGKVPNIRHVKPFGCQVTILNTSNHLGKFEGKANDGFLVGYAAHNKLNVQGLGQEWYLDLDYLTDSLGYTRFKINPHAGTHTTNIIAGTHADDSKSKCDEQVILVPSFPSNSFSGPTVHDVSALMENNLDYAEELDRLQRQEYEAHSTAAKHGFEFSNNTAALLPQGALDTSRNLVHAMGDPAGSIISAGGVSAGSVAASGVPAGSVAASGIPAGSAAASGDPTGSLPASHVPAGGVHAGSLLSAEFGDPATSDSVPAIFHNDPAASSPLPLGHSLGSCEHTTRFPSLFDLGNPQPTAGIFSFSSYDDNFCANVTNLALTVATKRVNTIHLQSQVIGDLQSPVQTRGTVQKSKFGESAFISYVHTQNRTSHADHQHCLFACFLSQLEPCSVVKALEDPDWVAAMQEEMQQFYHQQVWKLVPLPTRKITIGTKWILKNKRDARGIVVCNKARLVAQGHRQEEGIDYDEVFAPVARMEAIRLFLAFASYIGFMVYQMDVKSAFLYGTIDEEVYVTQPKGFEDPHNPKHVYRVVKALYGLHQAPRDCQNKYVKDMLKKFDMESVRTATTPYEVPKHRSKDEPDDTVNVHLYRSMIGSLMYLTASRPNIMFAVSACSRHQVTPLTSHLNALKKIFKYLKGQPNLGLWYPRDSLFQLEAYSDSDYVGSHGDRKSTTGGCQFMGRRLISWQCKKQTVVAISSTEAEYVAVASCCASCGLLLSFVSNVSGYPKLQVIQGLLLVVLVCADDLVPADGCTLSAVPTIVLVPTGSGTNSPGRYSFLLLDWILLVVVPIPTGSYLFTLMNLFLLVVVLFLLVVHSVGLVPTGGYADPAIYDDHNKVAYLEKGKGWEAYEQILHFLNRSHIRYALTHRPTMVFDSLVKQFWATATIRTLEAGPSDIIATIDGIEVVVTESLIRTQLQLDDVNGLYEFTIHDVLDGMHAIGYLTDGSLTFYKAKLSPQWRFLIHTLIHCMSPKSGGWNQFPSSLASALICMSTGRTYNFSRFIMDGMLRNVGSKRHKFLMYPRFLQMILGIQTTDPSPRPTFDFTAKLFSNMKLNWDGPYMPLLAPMLVVPAGEDAAGAAANVAAGPGPSSAPQVTPMREHTPVREPSPVRKPTPIREPSPRPEQEPTPNSPSPPSPPPSSAAVGPTTSSRPPSPSRHPSILEDIREGGDSAELTALSLKLDRCLHRVTTLENELGITKKALGGAVLKLVTRVKRLEGLLQQRKRRLVLSDSEGEDATTTEKEFDLAAPHTLASATLGDDYSTSAAGPDAETTMPVHSTSTTRRSLRKPFTSSASPHVSETIPAGMRVLAAATTIPAGSSVDAAAAPSFSIPTAADKGKAPMVDDPLPADLLSEQERVLKNLHDSQLGEELAKKIHAEQEADFARQQEELAQKAQAKIVSSPTEHGPGMSDQRRQELDAAQLIYTEADWLELLAKIATNSALSKHASVYNQGWTIKKVKTLSIDQLRLEFEYIQQHLERSNLLNFRRSTFRPKPTLDALDAPPAKRANQGAPQVPAVSSQDPAGVLATPSIPADVSLPAATSSALADILVPAVSIAHAAVFVPAELMVHTAESHMDDPLTLPEHGSSEPTVAAPTPSSSCHRREHIAKKWVTPIVDVANAAMIKFDSDSDSDDEPLPYAPYAGWEMVPSPLGFVHVYHNMAGHTKHFTNLREILHMVERTDLQRLLGAVDALYQTDEPDTFALLLWGDLHVLFQSLDDEDALHFWRNQDSWRIRSCRLYPRAQVHVLEMVDGRVIYMFVDVSYPLSVGTLERMLKHGLEVSKLLVGGDLTMAE
nr:ribonuclease H-like domain-containing protein [Tanacetum cinerariifolium]